MSTVSGPINLKEYICLKCGHVGPDIVFANMMDMDFKHSHVCPHCGFSGYVDSEKRIISPLPITDLYRMILSKYGHSTVLLLLVEQMVDVIDSVVSYLDVMKLVGIEGSQFDFIRTAVDILWEQMRLVRGADKNTEGQEAGIRDDKMDIVTSMDSGVADLMVLIEQYSSQLFPDRNMIIRRKEGILRIAKKIGLFE